MAFFFVLTGMRTYPFLNFPVRVIVGLIYVPPAESDLFKSHEGTDKPINPIENTRISCTKQPLDVLLYTLLYMAFLGSVIQPKPLGALKPKLWRITRFNDVRAAIRLVRDGMRKPNFSKGYLDLKITSSPSSNILTFFLEGKSFKSSFGIN